MIRAAISLKLSNFEETGGIVAALTTSIPESPGSRRNWDYRFCWLRDAYFVVKALNRIGATQTMEDFIFFIINIASGEPDSLRPVYSVVPTDPMEEWEAPHLKGYRGDGPVRIGNAAADQAQHDTYGSIILADHADVLRPPAADARRRERCFACWKPWAKMPSARARARRRHLGISRTLARPYAFGRDVLGRMQSPRRDRADARFARPRRILERRRRSHSRGADSKNPGMNRARPIPPPSAPTSSMPACLLLPELGVIEAERSAFHLHRRGHRARTSARQARHALRQPGRFRHAGSPHF